MREKATMKRSQGITSRFEENSFDVLRLFSAILIVLGHIVTHLGCNIWRPILMIQQNWPGLMCLFTLTGFLIPASLENSKSKKEFWAKRVSRIYPELWCAFAVSFIAVIIIGGGMEIYSIV